MRSWQERCLASLRRLCQKCRGVCASLKQVARARDRSCGAGGSCVVLTWSSFLLSRIQRFFSPRSHGSKRTPGLVAKMRIAGNVGFPRRDSGFRNGIRGLRCCVDHLHSVDEDASGNRSAGYEAGLGWIDFLVAQDVNSVSHFRKLRSLEENESACKKLWSLQGLCWQRIL